MAIEYNKMGVAQLELWDHSQYNWKHTWTHTGNSACSLTGNHLKKGGNLEENRGECESKGKEVKEDW